MGVVGISDFSCILLSFLFYPTGGTTYAINADGYSDYSVIIAPLTPGFHSVMSTDSNAYYAVFVYGYATPTNVAAYGYLGGYRYRKSTADHYGLPRKKSIMVMKSY